MLYRSALASWDDDLEIAMLSDEEPDIDIGDEDDDPIIFTTTLWDDVGAAMGISAAEAESVFAR